MDSASVRQAARRHTGLIALLAGLPAFGPQTCHVLVLDPYVACAQICTCLVAGATPLFKPARFGPSPVKD